MVERSRDINYAYQASGWRRLYVWLGRLLYWLTQPGQWLLLPMWRRAYVFLEYDQQVLLVKNWFSRGEWSLPGGGVSRGEDSQHAAVREVFEELGFSIKIDQLHELTSGFARRLIGGKRFVVYRVQLTHRPVVRVKKSELVALCWMPFVDFKKHSPLNYDVKLALRARSDISRKKR